MSEIKPTKTITYKKIGKLEILLDLYLPENANKVPVVLWFHGGGLVQGRRDTLTPHMRKGVHKYGYACVSADYRLAPQATIQEILEDVIDCIKFIREKLPEHVEKDVLDVSRLAVSGTSAGGYLALLAGLYATPKPKAILTIYAITDPLGTFFTNVQKPPMGMPLVSKEDLAPYLDPKAAQVANSGTLGEDGRMNMAVYMTVSGNLAELLGIPDPESAERFRVSRQIHKHRLPPTYIAHGDIDSAVGIEQADEVVGAMVGCGIEVEYERLHGKDHFFDRGGDYEDEALYKFLMKHL